MTGFIGLFPRSGMGLAGPGVVVVQFRRAELEWELEGDKLHFEPGQAGRLHYEVDEGKMHFEVK